MACIQKIKCSNTNHYRAIIKNKDVKTITKVFKTRKLAVEFAKRIEGNHELLLAYGNSHYHKISFKELIDKYLRNEYKGSDPKGQQHKLNFWIEKGVDQYWKFNIDAIDNISPYSEPEVRRRAMGEVMDYSNVKMSDEWFKVIMYTGGGAFFADIEITFYINRQGKESVAIQNNPVFGIIEDDLGVCKNYIKGENLDTLFKMQSELLEEREKAETERLKNLPPAKNWN